MSARTANFIPAGVIPACLLPFHADLSIDEAAYRSHLNAVAGVDGVTAIAVNAHSTEVSSCGFDEQVRVLDLTLEAVGDRVPVINGVYADGSLEAARIARMAERGGASCLLVFPPGPLALGSNSRPEIAVTHFKAIAEATDLPIIAFQYPLAGGLGYPVDTLLQMIEAVPSIVAIKDWCNNVVQHERHIRLLHGLPRPVKVLTTHSAWLLSSLVLGCDGLLSGSGSVIADLHVALWRAVQADDLARARQINDRIFPLAQSFYADPFIDMHNRMKQALYMLGRIPCPAVRPPLTTPREADLAAIAQALRQAGVIRAGAFA